MGMKFVIAVMFSFYFAGCFAGADHQNKQIYVYRITGPKVLQQFKAASSNKGNSSPQFTEYTDEILFRTVSYTHLTLPTISDV